MARWSLLGVGVLLVAEARAAPSGVRVTVEVFDRARTAEALSTSTFQLVEGEEGTGELLAGDRQMIVRARVGRIARDGCRPISVVLRESRQVPQRWRETSTRSKACLGERISIEPDRDTRVFLSVQAE